MWGECYHPQICDYWSWHGSGCWCCGHEVLSSVLYLGGIPAKLLKMRFTEEEIKEHERMLVTQMR